jgi:beta-glucanase (GH16 family)
MYPHAARRVRRLRRAAAIASALALVGVFAQATSGTGSAGAAVTCGGETPAAKPDGSAWACTFDDEFSSTTLNPVWTPVTTAATGVATGQGSYRGCYENSPDNVSVSKNGYLQLTVRRQRTAVSCPASTGTFTTNYTVGAVSTVGKFAPTYGRFEVRAKLPNTSIKGLQETFWLWPENPVKYAAYGPAYTEPTGEIDFAEFYSSVASRDIPYLHYNVDFSNVNLATGTNIYTALPAPNNEPGTSCTFDYTTWNTFSVVWEPGTITMYVNDRTCLVDNYAPAGGLSSPAPFNQPFFIALSQALGVTVSNSDNATTSKTPIPATTQIDYVRVWK